MPTLILLDANGRDQTACTISNDTTTFVGSAVSGRNGFQVPQPGVSFVHCRIEVQGDTFCLVNEAGKGTFVNAERVTRRNLQDGDVIGIGDAKIRFAQRSSSGSPLPNLQRHTPSPSRDLELQSSVLPATSHPPQVPDPDRATEPIAPASVLRPSSVAGHSSDHDTNPPSSKMSSIRVPLGSERKAATGRACTVARVIGWLLTCLAALMLLSSVLRPANVPGVSPGAMRVFGFGAMLPVLGAGLSILKRASLPGLGFRHGFETLVGGGALGFGLYNLVIMVFVFGVLSWTGLAVFFLMLLIGVVGLRDGFKIS